MPKPPCPGVEDHRRGGGHGRDKSRKYAINLLNGNIVFQESKGLGKTYKDDVKPVLAAIWNEVGCPCAPYFKAEIGRWVEKYVQHIANIPDGVRPTY